MNSRPFRWSTSCWMQRASRPSPSITMGWRNRSDGSSNRRMGRSATVPSCPRNPPLGPGSYPFGVAVDPVTGTVYVTNLGDDTVSVISGYAT